MADRETAPLPRRVLAARLATIALRVSGFAARSAARRLVRRDAAGTRRLGEDLAALLETLGPAFVKIGQVLSARPDLLSPDFCLPLARLQNEVAPVSAGETRSMIARYLREVGGEIAEVDPVPVGCGSIAQVHRARRRDGTALALKFLRPRAAAEVARDLELCRRASRRLGRLPMLRYMPVAGVVEQISRVIEQQTDFARERAMNRRLAATIAPFERVRLPRIEEELSTPTVIAMEFVETLTPVASPDLDAATRKAVALAGLRALYRMIFDLGQVHADMHPGNVFVGRHGELVLLDTGMMAELGERARHDFVDFFFGLADGDGRKCAAIVWDNALDRAPSADRERFDGDMRALIGRYSRLRSRDFEIAAFVAELIALMRAHRIVGDTSFMTTIVAMVVYDGICKMLHPECDFQAEARGYLVHARYARGGRRLAVGL